MKAHQLIADSLSSWLTYQDAADLAFSVFESLDEDERERLARRAFTDEFRSALRRKNADGLPHYCSVEKTDTAGQVTRVYKQTAAFEDEDFDVAIKGCRTRIDGERRTIYALQKAKAARQGEQLALETA